MPSKQPRFSMEDDPLTKAMAPPPDETEEQRNVRIAQEQEEKRISDEIDEELRKSAKKGAKPVKILLLGQSESGKSTTLKNFQLMNSSTAFHAERASWRAVIQCNIARSIRLIIDAMNDAQNAAYPASPSSSKNSVSRSSSRRNSEATNNHSSESQTTPTTPSSPALNADHLKLKMRLSPLIQVEEALARKLTQAGTSAHAAAKVSDGTRTHKAREFSVNSATQWKGVFGRLRHDARQSVESDLLIDWDDPQDPGVVLHACADDMKRLWNDPVIQKLLEMQNVRVEELAGFFLDDVDRVTSPRYIPNDDDILRARIKTLGVTEYRFSPKNANFIGSTLSTEWRVFDVGGQRSLRAAWVPYFDDMNAIIFLAAISSFDQTLAEDPSVNRLEDSVLLWKSINSNPLLKKTNLVLFLNKCDILKAKLAAGIRLENFVVSYGNRSNDFETASHYLRKKFAGIQKEHSIQSRPFYCHFTSVTETKSTKHILSNVQDMILRENLKKSNLMMD